MCPVHPEWQCSQSTVPFVSLAAAGGEDVAQSARGDTSPMWLCPRTATIAVHDHSVVCVQQCSSFRAAASRQHIALTRHPPGVTQSDKPLHQLPQLDAYNSQPRVCLMQLLYHSLSYCTAAEYAATPMRLARPSAPKRQLVSVVVLLVHLQPDRLQLSITSPVGQQPASNALNRGTQVGTPAGHPQQKIRQQANSHLIVQSSTAMVLETGTKLVLAPPCKIASSAVGARHVARPLQADWRHSLTCR